MKKKIMTVMVALAVMLCGTTAFAAESPTAGSTKVDTKVAEGQTATTTVAAPTQDAAAMAKATTVDNANVTVKEVSKTTVTEAVTETKNILNDVAKLGELTGNANLKAAAADSKKTVTATVLSVVNLESTAANQTVVIKNAAIKADKTYVVLHYTNGDWKTLPAKVSADGSLSFTTDNFSPFAIVEIGVKDTTPAADSTAPAGDANTSPATGETIPVAVFAMLVFVAGIVVCSRKKENN